MSAAVTVTSPLLSLVNVNPSFPVGSLILILATTFVIPTLLSRFSNQLQSSNVYRYSWVIAFILNCICVSIPGRFDGQMEDGRIAVVWRTLFAPSGWAFAIWGVIYLGELLASTGIAFLGNSSVRKASVFWLAGNLFQCLWCFAFRPQFKQALWLPSLLLALGAVSFGSSHRELTLQLAQAPDTWSRVALLLLRFPIALHTGWLAAAALLNLNGWVAVSNVSLDKQLAIATASAYLATALGFAYTLYSGDSFVGFTVAWALAALADKTANNCDVDAGPVAVQALALTERALSTWLLITSPAAPFVHKLF